MNGKKYRLVEFFSGIGSQLKAMKNLGMEVESVGTCEWDLHAFVAYDAIHNSTEIPSDIDELDKKRLLEKLEEFTISNSGKEPMLFSMLKTYSEETLKRIYTAIKRCNNYVDISSLTGDKLPEDIDIMTYSFPCQDLSNVGAFHGYNKGIDKDSGSRSSLLWQVGRILQEMKDAGKSLPRFLLMENVTALMNRRHRDNFHMWMDDLEKLGYINKYYPLNARDFGIPQHRPRLLMISVYVGDNDKLRSIVEEYFTEKSSPEDIVNDYRNSEHFHDIKAGAIYRNDYSVPGYLEEAILSTPNDTPSRKAIWDNNDQLVLKGNLVNPKYDTIRTITTKQDRNPNSGNIYFDVKDYRLKIEGRGTFRYLTPRECFMFMGFTEEDYDNVMQKNPDIHKNNKLFTRDKMLRMAGNSIPVQLLQGIFYQIKMIDERIDNAE